MRTLEQVLQDHPLPFDLELMQKIDIVKGAGYRRVLLDLPVGYGKTVISTCISLMLGPELTIILVPPILIVQWVQWLNSVPNAGRALGYTGSPKHRSAYKLENFDYIIMSYQVFNNDFERFERACVGHEVLTIVDEAQALKGRGVLWKNVNRFTAGRDLVMMSGTIMSKPGDAYAYIKLLTPEIYPSYAMFENTHVEERNIFKQPTKWCHMDLMQANLSMRRVYRTKEEVHSALPKARYVPIYYDLAPDHMALYKRLMEEMLLVLDDGSKIDATTAVKLYHAAQQIITNYDVYSGDPTKKSAVFDLVDTIMDEIDLGELGNQQQGIPRASKLILWTIYKKTSAAMLAHMQGWLTKHQPGRHAVAAYSEVNSKKSIASFLGDENTVGGVFQPGSAGAGLNPQHLCWHCGFIEIPTTTIPFVQSAGRIDRKGQRFNPIIRLFIARGTIQEQLLKNLFSNDNLVQRASGTKQGIKSLVFP